MDQQRLPDGGTGRSGYVEMGRGVKGLTAACTWQEQ
jgi:hypothetical protein